ncbi:hypothetical protein Hdeb2414_s0046g00746761 [Helianthus debilis subsp. tardiflorus]
MAFAKLLSNSTKKILIQKIMFLSADGFQDFEELEVCKEAHKIEWENFYRRIYVFRL